MGLPLAKDLQVFIDSSLITNHFNGTYEIKWEILASCLKILKKIASEFEAFTLNQVPKEDNVEADALANLGSSLRIPLETRIPIVHIMIPIIEDPSNHDQTANIAVI